FPVPWTQRPSPQFEREFMQHHWRARAAWTPQRWRLILAVFHDGAPIGCQDVIADDFPLLREVRTGSWLGRPFQGRGFGKQMRAAVLHLAFAGLGAVTARTSAFADNPASLAVTRALGYEPNGVTRDLRGERRPSTSTSSSPATGGRPTGTARSRWRALRPAGTCSAPDSGGPVAPGHPVTPCSR